MTFFTKEEQDKVMMAVIEALISAAFNCHIYRWEGRVRRQVKGGAIGLRCTGSLAKICMDSWCERFEEILREIGVEIFLITKYVDDIFIICRTLELNTFWDGKKLVKRGAEYAPPLA